MVMNKNVSSICVRVPQTIGLQPEMRNSLNWTLRNDIQSFSHRCVKPFEFLDDSIVFNDVYPLHNLLNEEVWGLIESRRFFSVGLSFVHPVTHSHWQGFVQFSGVAKPLQQLQNGYGYEGKVAGLKICLERCLVPSIESRCFFNTIDGHSVKFEAFTPVCFDKKHN